MQLTTKFAILASAVAFSAPAVFALPINANTESHLATRDVEYLDVDAREVAEFDAREIDELEFAARELIDQYHEARDYYDELDARAYSDELDARAYLEELDIDARDFYNYLVTRETTTPGAVTTTTGTTTTGTTTTGTTTTGTADNAAFIKVHGEKKTEIAKIAKVPTATVDKIEKEAKGFKELHVKLAAENVKLQKEVNFTPPTRTPEQAATSLKHKNARVARLTTIATYASAWGTPSANKNLEPFIKAIAEEKAYETAHEAKAGKTAKRDLGNQLYARSDATASAHLDPKLAAILSDSTNNKSPLYLYALQVKRQLEAYKRLESDPRTPVELKKAIEAKYVALADHIKKSRPGSTDQAALKVSADYEALLDKIKNNAAADHSFVENAIADKKQKADRLENILKNPTASAEDIKKVLAELNAKPKKGGQASTLRRRRL